MPTSTIPFDPSLVLGMIIDPAKIAMLETIAELQLPVDLARDHINALLRQKLSMDMTSRELISLGVPTDQLDEYNKTLEELGKDIVAAAGDLAKAVIATEKAIVAAKSQQGQKQIASQLQSPIDFTASQLTSLPISSDSLSMDVQYFRYEDNDQTSASTSSQISTFVGVKVTELLGSQFGAQAAASASNSVATATDNHSIKGTLVICANCTSRQAQVFSPLVIDVEAAIDTYDLFAGGGGDKMPVEDTNAMKKVALTAIDGADSKALPVLIGATYGSSFVGFVHFEQVERTTSSQEAEANAVQARAEADDDLILANVEGSWGLDAQSASSLKNLLSTSNIQSHCSVITMGLIPSIKSNQVITSVKALQNDPKTNMQELAAMQDANDGSNTSVAAGAAAARKGEAMSQMKSDYVAAAIDAVAKVDESTNQVIDLNSLQVALDDYVEKAAGGTIGVPINFYVKYITKRDIAQAWMEKYYPAMLHTPEAAKA